MSKRITNLSESPCYKCGMQEQCEEKVTHNIAFQDIVKRVFGDADYDYRACGLWLALKWNDVHRNEVGEGEDW